MDAYGAAESSRYVSPNVVDVLGHPAEAFVTDTYLWRVLVHPDDVERADAAWNRGWAIGTGWSVEYRFVHPDGHDVWVRDEARMVVDPATGEPTWQGVIIDLTVQKQSEAELRRSELLHRALVEQVPAVVYLDRYDEGPHTTFDSPRVSESTGIPARAMDRGYGAVAADIHPDDLERVRAGLRVSFAQSRTLDVELRSCHVDGHGVSVHGTCSPVMAEDGWVEYSLGVMLDVAEQRLAERRLLAGDADTGPWSNRCRRSCTRWAPTTNIGPCSSPLTSRRSRAASARSGSTIPTSGWSSSPRRRERELAAHDRHRNGEPWPRDPGLIATTAARSGSTTRRSS